jgi:hypothetical protein
VFIQQRSGQRKGVSINKKRERKKKDYYLVSFTLKQRSKNNYVFSNCVNSRRSAEREELKVQLDMDKLLVKRA